MMSRKIRDPIRVSTGEGSGQVLKKMGKSRRASEKGPGEYREIVESGRVSKKGSGEYREMVESR